jgi:hypothetical protein
MEGPDQNVPSLREGASIRDSWDEVFKERSICKVKEKLSHTRTPQPVTLILLLPSRLRIADHAAQSLTPCSVTGVHLYAARPAISDIACSWVSLSKSHG